MNKKRIAMFIIFLLFVFSIYVCTSLWISRNYIVIREYTINQFRLEKSFRAVVIADLHDYEFGENNQKLVEKIREISPDIIIMDGDMLNGHSKNADIPCRLIENLKEVAPIYYALGNHEKEYLERGHYDFLKELETAGAVILDKNYVDIEVNGVEIRLGGMYDYAFGLDGENSAMSAPKDILSFLKDFQNTDRLKIMLAHRPDSFVFGDASKVWDIDLIICGHNHGGQVVLPFVGGLYGGDQGWFPEYVHGLYEKDNFQIFVTSGLGTSGEKLPRFNNPPEIAVLTIE